MGFNSGFKGLTYVSKKGTALFFRATDMSYREKCFYPIQPKGRRTRWRSWLRHCVTSRKFAGSISGCITRIFHWHTVRRADNLTTFMCRLSWNLGASTSWNPQGLSRPVMGLLYFLPLTTVFSMYPTAVTPTNRTTLYFETSENTSITRCRNTKNIITSYWKVQIHDDAYLHISFI